MTATHTQLLSASEVASRLGSTIGTLAWWRTQRKGPPYVKVEGSVRYPEAELEKWIAARVVEPRT